MNTETVKMSTKGQIVIPQSIREAIKADEGTLFSIINEGDTIVLKKIEKPSREEIISRLHEMAKEGKKRLQAMGITEKDLRKY